MTTDVHPSVAAPVPGVRALRRARVGRGRGLANVLRVTFLVFVALVAVAPLAWGLITSIKPPTEVITSPPTWWPQNPTLENYRVVLFGSGLLRNLGNSLIVAVTTSVVCVVIGLLGGYAAARLKFRSKNAAVFLILATSMVPGIAILVPLYKVGISLGVHNTYTYLVLVYGAWQMPTVLYMMKGFIAAVPHELEESAMIEGCTRLGAFLRVTVPALRPGIAAASLIVFIFVWNDWLVSTILTSTDAMRLLQTGLFRFIGDYGVAWGNFMAYVMVATVPIVVGFLALERFFVTGLTAGSVKG